MTKIMQDLRSQKLRGQFERFGTQKNLIPDRNWTQGCHMVSTGYNPLLFHDVLLVPITWVQEGYHGTDKTPKMTVNFYQLTSYNGQEAPNSNMHRSKSLKSRYTIPALSKCSIHHTYLQYFSTCIF